MSSPTKKLKVFSSIINKVAESSSTTKPLSFELLDSCGHARRSVMTLPHGEVDLPIFMPVGTKGTIKGVTSEEMHSINCKILLSNTYHLESKPGSKFIHEFGGRPDLTQVFTSS